MQTIHVSQMPMLSICSGLLTLPGESITYDSGDAAQGKLVHEAAAAIVEGREPQQGVPFVGTLKAIWAELSGGWTNAESEIDSVGHCGDYEIVGKMDVVARDGDTLVVVDWFCGQNAPDKRVQGMGYCWLMSRHHEFQSFRFIEVNVPDASMRAWTWTREQLDSWAADFFYNLSRPPSFSVGSHCRWCQKYASCPAHTALMRKAADVLQVVDAVERLPRGQKGQLWEPLKLLASMVEAAQESIKADVALNGDLPLGGDYVLRATDVERVEIAPLEAWPILSERFSDEELAGCIKISKTELQSLASAKAPRGEKGKAKEEIIDALRVVGAVTQSVYQKVSRARKEKGE